MKLTAARATRGLALACLLASAPLALVKYPWLPATVLEFVELQGDPVPAGTPSYHAGRAERRRRVETALLLYALGTASLAGLVQLAGAPPGGRAVAAIWLVAGGTALGIVGFERGALSPGVDPAYVVIAVVLPLFVAVVSAVGVALALRLQHQRGGTP